jgi:hypothetical protein
MVDMMITNIAGEPMEDPRQIVVGAAGDGGLSVIP